MRPLHNHPISLAANLISTEYIYAKRGAKNNINIANHLGEYLSAGSTRNMPQKRPATSKEHFGNLLIRFVTESADKVLHRTTTIVMRTRA